jgi:hypothetical protein
VFYLASIDENILWNIWAPKIQEAVSGEETLPEVNFQLLLLHVEYKGVPHK